VLRISVLLAVSTEPQMQRSSFLGSAVLQLVCWGYEYGHDAQMLLHQQGSHRRVPAADTGCAP
jgi:hypothetical protein